MELRLTPFEEFEYGNWYNAERYELVQNTEAIPLIEFFNELASKSTSFLNELSEINPKLLSRKYIAELQTLVNSLQKPI